MAAVSTVAAVVLYLYRQLQQWQRRQQRQQWRRQQLQWCTGLTSIFTMQDTLLSGFVRIHAHTVEAVAEAAWR